MLTYIRDIGMAYATEKSLQRNHYDLYLCSGCNKEYWFQTSQIKAGYTNWCKKCGMKYKNKEK